MPRTKIHRPLPVYLIAGFQILKGDILLTLAAYLWFAPDRLPHTEAFSQILFIAAHGKDLSGYLVPAFGLYLCYVGLQLFRMRPRTRTTLAISSAITIALSLQRLGVFGDTDVHDPIQREALYIVILLDLAVYIYLAFHPAINRSFSQNT